MKYAEFDKKMLSPTLRERFWSYAERHPCGCLLWTGAVSPYGYGRISVWTGRSTLASRVAWYLEYGEWPKGELRHSCDTPGCVDVSHLSCGTHKENARDMVERGRSLVGVKNPSAKLTEAQVVEARRLWLAGLSLSKTAKLFGINRQTMTEVCYGRYWKHVEGHSETFASQERIVAGQRLAGHQVKVK